MATDFKINGTTLTYIMKADWQAEPIGQAFDGPQVYSRWHKHIWQTEAMSMSEFATLYALEGQKVNITTTNATDRNADYMTYYGVDFERITARHESQNVANVMCEFLVRL